PSSFRSLASCMDVSGLRKMRLGVTQFLRTRDRLLATLPSLAKVRAQPPPDTLCQRKHLSRRSMPRPRRRVRSIKASLFNRASVASRHTAGPNVRSAAEIDLIEDLRR